MITQKLLDSYEATIGIECHVQLKTKTKLFAPVSNDAVDAEPNTLVCEICYGLPGVLPILNEAAVDLAIKAGTALNAKVATFSKFDRKHYFYPDLPLGYQITQFDQPIIGEGKITIHVDGEPREIGITRAHLEADAGKLTHPTGKKHSLVDLNRAGTPLLEIVSEPDMHTPAEARRYAQELYYLMKYADVSDVDLYHGNMRFDVNVSVAKKGSTELGTRTETKNLNSFRSVEKAAEYEIRRQIEQLEKGEVIVQETRGWDDAKNKTVPQRSKEDAHDYRYFPDPDLPPVVLEQSYIDEIAATVGILPPAIRAKLTSAGLNAQQAEVLLEQDGTAGISFIDTILQLIDKDASAASYIAKWLSNVAVVALQAEEIAAIPTVEQCLAIAKMAAADELSSTNAKKLMIELSDASRNSEDARAVAEAQNLIQSSDSGEIEAIVDGVIAENASAADDVRNGEMKAIGFLVGQVMKQSKGQANPKIVQELLRSKLT